MKTLSSRLAFFLLLIINASGLVLAAPLAVPPLTNHVEDLTATLNPQQVAELDESLRAFENLKGSQIAVLIVPSTQPETIEQYGLRVAEQWKLGRKKIDDGAILLIAKNDRTVRIEVGYGLEGALNDATAKRIIEETITPHFKQGDFYGGIGAGIDRIIKVVDGEPLPPREESRGATGVINSNASPTFSVQQLLPIILIGAFIGGGILRALFGRVFGALITGGLIGLVAWLIAGAIFGALIAGLLGFFVTLMGGGGRGGGPGIFPGGGFGGFGGGGFGGGGFGGGGGGFGGGGASGRW